MRGIAVVLFITFFTTAIFAQEESDTSIHTVLEYNEADSLLRSSQTDSEEAESDDSYNYEEEDATEYVLVDPGDVAKKSGYTEEKLDVRKFDKKKWREIIGETDYEEEKPKKEPEKEAKEEGFKFNMPWGSPILKVIAYAIVIGIVIAILYYVTKSIKIDYKVDKRGLTADDPIEHVEHIEDLDIHQLLQKSLTEGNFKVAVRLYFLRLLKKLHEGGVIEWKKDKTNRDYLTEIFSKDYYFTELRQLTIAYEQIWYGEHIISSESYKELFSEFETVHQKLNTTKDS